MFRRADTLRKFRVVLCVLVNGLFTMINEETNFRRTVRVKSHNADVEDNNFVGLVDDVAYDQIRKKSVGTEDGDIYDILMKVREKSLFEKYHSVCSLLHIF